MSLIKPQISESNTAILHDHLITVKFIEKLPAIQIFIATTEGNYWTIGQSVVTSLL